MLTPDRISILKEHMKQTIKLAFPVMLGQIGHVMMGVVDSVMVGQVSDIGATYLAAASLVNGLYFLVIILGIGLSVAVTPLVAIAKGGNNHDECGIILRQSLLINMLFTVVLVIATYILAINLNYLDQPPEVVLYAESYFKIITFSTIPFMIFQTYKQFAEGLSITMPAMLIALLANIVNALTNWILIYGKYGAPELGLDGAGVATLSNRTFMAVAMAGYVFLHPRFKEYDPSLHFRGINFPVIKKVLAIGVPSALQYFFEVSSFSFAAIMVGWIGKAELAAHQIALSLASISYMITLGIGAGGTIRVGNFFGAKDRSLTRRAGFSAILLAVMFMSCSGITFILFRNYLPYIYNNDPAVVSIASSLLIVTAFFQLSDGIQATGQSILRGITDVQVPMYLSFVSYWIVGIGSCYLLGFVFNYGVVGVWFGLLLGLTVTAIFFTIRFNLKTKSLFRN